MPPFKIPPSVRKKILESLLTSPQRKEMMKKAAPVIEDLANAPSNRRMYVGGSFASDVPEPSDIDLVIKRLKDFDTLARESGLTNKRMEQSGVHPLSVEEFAPQRGSKDAKFLKQYLEGEQFAPEEIEDVLKYSHAREWMEEGKKKYGPNYKWIRILGLLGALSEASDGEENGR